jgi:hypothetical protein
MRLSVSFIRGPWDGGALTIDVNAVESLPRDLGELPQALWVEIDPKTRGRTHETSQSIMVVEVLRQYLSSCECEGHRGPYLLAYCYPDESECVVAYEWKEVGACSVS